MKPFCTTNLIGRKRLKEFFLNKLLTQTLFFAALSKYLLLVGCNPSPSSSVAMAYEAKSPPAHLVKTTTVNLESLITSAVYTGSLRAQRLVRIFTQEEGRITGLPYYPGDLIETDTLLVQLDDALLRAQLDKAIATHQQSRVNVQRLQKLANRQLVSAEELLRAQTEQEIARAEEHILRTRLTYTQIKAPFAGIVTARLAEPGDVVAENTQVLTIIDPASLVIDVYVSERLFSQLSLKDKVSVRIDALGTESFNGFISRLHPTIDLHTRLGIAEITLNPLPKEAREGQFCRVTIEAQMKPRLTIPYSALRRDPEGEYVFLVDTEQKAQRQAVRSGLRLADKVEVIEGLTRGQVIIVKGFLGLQNGDTVQIFDPVQERM